MRKILSTRYDSLIDHYIKKNPGMKPKAMVDKILEYEALDVTDATLRDMISRYMKGIPNPVSTSYDGNLLSIVVGCIHFPFHNPHFWGAFLNYLSWVDGQGIPYEVHLNGDVSDMVSLSRHQKGMLGMPGMTLGLEYSLTNKELDNLDQATTHAVAKHFRYGNHEKWWFTHMKEVDNAKVGEEMIMAPHQALRYKERGYSVETSYTDGQYWLDDTTLIQHGSHLSVHASHQAVQKMKVNVIFNHTHRAGVWTERTQQGHLLYGVNGGWMGDVNSSAFGYMTLDQRRMWQNAFTQVHLEDGQTTPELIISPDSKTFWAFGKKFAA